MYNLWQKLKRFLRNLNLFPSITSATDEHQFRNEIIATRLFLFLFLFSLVILLLYTSLITVAKIANVEEPSFARYSQLHSLYPRTLTCPCTKISIDYSKILYVNYTFHQVCSSIFVTDIWIGYLATITSAENNHIYVADFRATGPTAFQALKGLCALINQTLSDSLIGFYRTQYVSGFVTSFDVFQSETLSLIDEFRRTIINEFLLSVSMIGKTTKGNALLAAVRTGYLLNVTRPSYQVYVQFRQISGCSCFISTTCITQSYIYRYPDPNTILLSIPGFYRGCYPIESLLQSTLQCFYNQTCVDAILPLLVLAIANQFYSAGTQHHKQLFDKLNSQ